MSLDNVGTPWHIVRALERDLGRPFALSMPARIIHAACTEYRGLQDTRYWFRLATSRGTTDFYVGRINFIAPPEGITIKHKVKQRDGGVKVIERFIPGGEPIKGTDFASAVVWYGPDFKPGDVRWRDAETGELIDVKRARELREEAAA